MMAWMAMKAARNKQNAIAQTVPRWNASIDGIVSCQADRSQLKCTVRRRQRPIRGKNDVANENRPTSDLWRRTLIQLHLLHTTQSRADTDSYLVQPSVWAAVHRITFKCIVRCRSLKAIRRSEKWSEAIKLNPMRCLRRRHRHYRYRFKLCRLTSTHTHTQTRDEEWGTQTKVVRGT